MTNPPVAIGVAPDAPPEPDAYDWPALVDGLNRYLRLKATPVGMKLFDTVAEMEVVERIRRPDRKHALDQIVAQARWLNRTLGITMDDLTGPQCGAPVGLYPQEPAWRKSTNMSGVWFATDADAIAHQEAMDCLPAGRYHALAVSPLATGRLNPPDIALIYATPGQMIILINALQFSGYKKLEFSCVGESACADSWGRALRTGEPSLSIPLLRRATLRRRPGRRTPHGHPTPLPAQDHRRSRSAEPKRPALPHRLPGHRSGPVRVVGPQLRPLNSGRPRYNPHPQSNASEQRHLAPLR